MMDVAFVLSIALPIVDWTAAAILLVAAWSYPVTPLRERALAAVFLALAATGVGLVLANRAAGHVLPADTTSAVILAVVVLVSAPALYWLALLVAGRFD